MRAPSSCGFWSIVYVRGAYTRLFRLRIGGLPLLFYLRQNEPLIRKFRFSVKIARVQKTREKKRVRKVFQYLNSHFYLGTMLTEP